MREGGGERREREERRREEGERREEGRGGRGRREGEGEGRRGGEKEREGRERGGRKEEGGEGGRGGRGEERGEGGGGGGGATLSPRSGKPEPVSPSETWRSRGCSQAAHHPGSPEPPSASSWARAAAGQQDEGAESFELGALRDVSDRDPVREPVREPRIRGRGVRRTPSPVGSARWPPAPPAARCSASGSRPGSVPAERYSRH